MTYEREQLYDANIHSLRAIAREIGVHAPTCLNKKALIDEILQIENGTKQPCAPTKRGRPLKNDLENRNGVHEQPTTSNLMDLKENMKKEFISSVLREIEKQLNKLL